MELVPCLYLGRPEEALGLVSEEAMQRLIGITTKPGGQYSHMSKMSVFHWIMTLLLWRGGGSTAT